MGLRSVFPKPGKQLPRSIRVTLQIAELASQTEKVVSPLQKVLSNGFFSGAGYRVRLWEQGGHWLPRQRLIRDITNHQQGIA